MSFRMLGSRIEYLQASKRLEELTHARPGTPQAQERKELIDLFREFEKEIKEVKATPLEKSKNKKKKIELYYSPFELFARLFGPGKLFRQPQYCPVLTF